MPGPVFRTNTPTCSREKIKYDALGIIDSLNKVPTRVADTGSVGCEDKYRSVCSKSNTHSSSQQGYQ